MRPTIADLVAMAWRTKRNPNGQRVHSLAAEVKRAGAETTKIWQGKHLVITHTFGDDTSITVVGRGRHHTYQTHLPLNGAPKP